MQRTKAERAPIVAAIMARRRDMGLAPHAAPIPNPRMPRSHPWNVAKDIAAAEARARRGETRRRGGTQALAIMGRAASMRTEGVKIKDIAAALGCSVMTVRRALEMAGLTKKIKKATPAQ